jgi:hypothetical protein
MPSPRLAEGMTEKDVPHYPGRIDALREAGKQLPALNKQLAEVRGLLKGMAGREGTERHGKAQALERELLDLLGAYRHDVLRFGAVGRLLVAREVEAVLPLDDAQLLDRAQPVTKGGEVKPDPEQVKARQDAQVKAALESGPVAVIVLGGSHDLSASVRALGRESCAYLRVTTKRYGDVAEGEEPCVRHPRSPPATPQPEPTESCFEAAERGFHNVGMLAEAENAR